MRKLNRRQARKLPRVLLVIALGLLVNAGFAQYQNDNGYNNQDEMEQEQEQSQPKVQNQAKLRHYFVGGNFIASFGDGGGAFGINPSIGYSLSPYVDVGLGFNGVYNYSKDYYYGGKWRTWNLGVAPFVRLYPVDFLFFEGSFEENLVSSRYVSETGEKSDRQNASAPSLIGAIGYTNRIFGQSSFFISVGMDFLNNKNSPYRESYYDDAGTLRSRPTAIIRTGFNINLW